MMSRDGNKKIVGAMIAILIAIILVFLFNNKTASEQLPNVWDVKATSTLEALKALPTEFTEANSNEFVHQHLKFSFRFPTNLTPTNFLDEESNEVIIVQDPTKGIGFQVVISAFDESTTTLTADRIKQDIPDLQIRDVQEIILGNVGKGIAFRSDNEDYNGDSREVWFVLNGKLYQVSTYAYLDPLLQAVMNSWQFN